MRNILPIWGQIIQTCKMISFSWLLSDDGDDDIAGNDYDDDQVVEVAEDVDAEEGRADSEDVKVELVVWQDAGVPANTGCFFYWPPCSVPKWKKGQRDNQMLF